MISRFNRRAPYLFFGALALAFCLWGYCSAARPLWADESVTIELVKSSSLTHMLSAISDGLDATPPLYTIYGWLMLHYITPYAEPNVIFRVTNAIAVTATITILYALSRRFFDVIHSILLISFFILIDIYRLLFLILEIRTYAMFVFAETVAIYYSAASFSCPSRKKFIYIGLSYCFLIASHTFGIVYVICISGSLILCHIFSSNLKLARNTLISTIPAILLFCVWSTFIIRLAQLGSWIPRPRIVDLLSATYLPISLRMSAIAIVIILAAAIFYILRNGLFSLLWSFKNWLRSQDNMQKFIVMIPISFGLSTLSIWILSRFAFHAYVVRYFFPNIICNIIWLGAFVNFIVIRFPRVPAIYGMLCALVPLAVINFEHIPSQLLRLLERIPCFDPVQKTYIEDSFRDGTPILTLWSHSWLTRLNHPGDEKIFPIDQSLSKQGGVESQEYNFESSYATRFAAWDGHPTVASTEGLINAKRDFLVLDDDSGPWLKFVQKIHKLRLTKLSEMRGCRLWRLEIDE